MTPLTATEVVFTVYHDPMSITIMARPVGRSAPDATGMYVVPPGDDPYSREARAAALADLNRKLRKGKP